MSMCSIKAIRGFKIVVPFYCEDLSTAGERIVNGKGEKLDGRRENRLRRGRDKAKGRYTVFNFCPVRGGCASFDGTL